MSVFVVAFDCTTTRYGWNISAYCPAFVPADFASLVVASVFALCCCVIGSSVSAVVPPPHFLFQSPFQRDNDGVGVDVSAWHGVGRNDA